MIVARWIWIQTRRKKKILPARPPPLALGGIVREWSMEQGNLDAQHVQNARDVLCTRDSQLWPSYWPVQRAHMILRYDGTLQWRFDRTLTIQRPPHANVWRAVGNLAEGAVSGVSG